MMTQNSLYCTCIHVCISRDANLLRILGVRPQESNPHALHLLITHCTAPIVILGSSLSLGMLSVGESITDDVDGAGSTFGSLRRSSHWFAWHHNGPDVWYFFELQMDTSSTIQIVISSNSYTIHSCSLFPFIFCGNLLLLYRSCRFLLLLPTTVGITKLCNCSLHFAYNWVFACQCNTAVARDEYHPDNFFGNTIIMINNNTGAVPGSSKGSMNPPFCPAVTDP